MSFEAGEDGGEFEIDHAKTSVLLPVGYVANIGIVMAHAEFFEFGEDFVAAFVVEVFDAAAAVGGDDAEALGIGFEKARHEWAAAGLEEFEDFGFLREAFLGFWAVVRFDDTAIECEMDGGAESVFDLQRHIPGK